MKKTNLIKIITAILFVVTIVAVIWIDHFLILLSCQEKTLSQVYSPSRHYLAQYCDLGCNATVGFVQKVKVIDTKDFFASWKKGMYSILPGISDAIFGLDGTVFTLDSQQPIKMHWASNSKLIISYPASAKVYRQDTRWQAVIIDYEHFQVP